MTMLFSDAPSTLVTQNPIQTKYSAWGAKHKASFLFRVGRRSADVEVMREDSEVIQEFCIYSTTIPHCNVKRHHRSRKCTITGIAIANKMQ
jgi:hypothetical protein